MVFLFILCINPVSAQRNIRIGAALENASEYFAGRLPSGSKVVILNFRSSHEALTEYIINELTMHLVHDERLIVIDRQNLEVIRQEMGFQLSGEVSDESAQRIGNILGAQTIISGAIAPVERNVYRLNIQAIAVETAMIQGMLGINIARDATLTHLTRTSTEPTQQASAQQSPSKDKTARLNTIGISAGTSFAHPWVIGTLYGTVAPFRYSFLQIGADVGFVSGIPDVDYFSIYPFANYAIFAPFKNKGGWYIGAGGGYYISRYNFPEGQVPLNLPVANVVTGFNIANIIDISYTMRTNFSVANNKLSLGLTYRFK